MRYTLFITLLVLLFSSNHKLEASDCHYIQVNGSKIFLRYSDRTTIEKVLGAASDTKYFEHGGEDFYWNNFIVCSYDSGNLSFHYNNNGNIIRVTVNSQCNYIIVLHEESIKNISYDVVLEKINTMNKINLYTTSKFIMYTRTEGTSSVEYAYWFDNEGAITWFDMYYERPW
jgi:hypothetical protein